MADNEDLEQPQTPDPVQVPAEPRNAPPDTSVGSSSGGRDSGGSFLHKKLLIIGGAGGGVVLLAIIAVVLVFTQFVGGGLPQPGSLLELVPEDAAWIVIANYSSLLEDEDFAEAMGISDPSRTELAVGKEELASIDQVSQRITLPNVTLMKGEFVFEDIRDILADLN